MSTNRALAENKMGVMPVNKLLLSMSLPMMVSMLIQALYNIVDSIFVAQINENALTAVSLAFPFQNLMMAIGVGTGVGINALLSRNLGKKDYNTVNKIAENGILLGVLSYLVILIIGVFGSYKFFTMQTTNTEIIEYGFIYMIICSVGSFGLFTQLIFEKLLQATGKTMLSMITQIIGAVVNIILDPILIFGYFGFPKMGVAGAALATVIGQIIGAIVAVRINQTKNKEISINLKKFRPSLSIIKQIYAIGIPTIIMLSIGSIMVFGLNKILMLFSTTASAVLGVYFKLQSFVFMPIFGLGNGMVPIISYNFGAHNKERIVKTMKLSIGYAVGVMLVGMLLFQLFASELLSFFNASEEMLLIGVPALRIVSIGFVVAGYCIISSSVFQAMGHGVSSMLMSILRQLVVLLPVAYLLSKLGNVNVVWFAFPIAEVCAGILCTFFLRRIYKNSIKPLTIEQ